MSSDETAELIARARRDDGRALDELMRRHLAPLRAFVRARSGALVRRRESDSDLVQSACREALRDLESFEWRGAGSFRQWLFTVALNKLRSRGTFYGAERRNPAREVDANHAAAELAEVYATISTPSQHAIAHEVVAQVEAALDRLTEPQRELILLSRIVGLGVREIAVQLGKTENAVHVGLSRALARLAGAMRAIERESG